MAGTSRIPDVLAALNAPSPPQRERAVVDLSPSDQLILVAWDTAVTLGLEPGSISVSESAALVSPPWEGGKVRVTLDANRTVGALVHYPLLGVSSVILPTSGRPTETHDASDLLGAAWYVGYRIDDLLYYPPLERQEILKIDSAALNLDPLQLLALAAWFPALQKAAVALEGV